MKLGEKPKTRQCSGFSQFCNNAILSQTMSLAPRGGLMGKDETELSSDRAHGVDFPGSASQVFLDPKLMLPVWVTWRISPELHSRYAHTTAC